MKNEDVQHLNLLSVFHYVVGGFTALFACLPLIHVGLGIAMLMGKLSNSTNGQGPPEFVGWLFVIMGGIFVVLGWTLAIMIIVAGVKLRRRKNRIFCMVVAGIECMLLPLGTILGVFTLVVLSKESVREGFDGAPGPEPELLTSE